MNPKPVDGHCHLYLNEFEDDREKIINSSQKRLEFAAVPGMDFETNKKTLKLSNRYEDFIIPNLGLHPTYKHAFDNTGKIESQIIENNPVAIGEIGLDHHHITSKKHRKRQKKAFEKMLELAEELNKGVVVHSREAEELAHTTIQQYDIPKVFMHCFNGKPRLADKITGSKTKIGVTTQILYSSRVQDIVKAVDIGDIILETDSPYLYRGERNEPSNVVESAQKIGEIKNIDTQKVISKTTGNSARFFEKHDAQ